MKSNWNWMEGYNLFKLNQTKTFKETVLLFSHEVIYQHQKWREKLSMHNLFLWAREHHFCQLLHLHQTPEEGFLGELVLPGWAAAPAAKWGPLIPSAKPGLAAFSSREGVSWQATIFIHPDEGVLARTATRTSDKEASPGLSKQTRTWLVRRTRLGPFLNELKGSGGAW